MAVFTQMSIEDARTIALAHQLGVVKAVIGVAAGSVNSNFFLETERGRFFARIYEEQEQDGVAYEWALLDHLTSKGLPVAQRVLGPRPGAIRIDGKPIAVFSLVAGDESCQALVSEARAHAVGTFLGQAHAALQTFEIRRASRFAFPSLRERLDSIDAANRAELQEPAKHLRANVEALLRADTSALTRGVIHGDLFRDNVKWHDGTRISGVLDWESASDGICIYDLMVAMLAWCYGDDLDWKLARAMVRGYNETRALSEVEWQSLRQQARAAATRFSITRITDYYLRDSGIGDRVIKDWRRFYGRLEAIEAMTDEAFVKALRP